MSLWASLDRRERAILGACAYLGALLLSCIIMWWLILFGGQPFHVENIGVVSSTGMPDDRFKPGQVAGIRRRVCAEREVGIAFYPSLIDSRGFLFPLPSGMVKAGEGCRETIYGLIVPDLPPGEYTYSSTVKYQNNLVGRDQSATFPPLRIRITR